MYLFVKKKKNKIQDVIVVFNTRNFGNYFPKLISSKIRFHVRKTEHWVSNDMQQSVTLVTLQSSIISFFSPIQFWIKYDNETSLNTQL